MKVYDGIVYFDDWLETEGYPTRQEMVENLICDGKTEEEAENHIQEIFELFEQWAEERDYNPQQY